MKYPKDNIEREHMVDLKTFELGDQPASHMTARAHIAMTIAAAMWASDIMTKAVLIDEFRAMDYDKNPSINDLIDVVAIAEQNGDLAKAIASSAYLSATEILREQAGDLVPFSDLYEPQTNT